MYKCVITDSIMVESGTIGGSHLVTIQSMLAQAGLGGWGVLPTGCAPSSSPALTSPTLSGQVSTTRTSLTATGGAATLNFSQASRFCVTLVDGANTLTLSGLPASGVAQTVVVELIQSSNGATVTWSGPTVSWGAAGAPTLSDTAGTVDVVTFSTVSTSEVRAVALLGFAF